MDHGEIDASREGVGPFPGAVPRAPPGAARRKVGAVWGRTGGAMAPGWEGEVGGV